MLLLDGKSTLSDSILQYLGNINAKQRKKGQVLDTLQVERERGITGTEPTQLIIKTSLPESYVHIVKAQTASMIFNDKRNGQRYLLNLIDTPGHVDFSYEVSRSLSSCQGALLLVDAAQSVQAQTISNYNKALKLGLGMIPVVTKIDLQNAMPEEAALALETAFKIDPDSVIMTSAKANIGIREVIEAIVDRLPAPTKAITFDIKKAFRGRIVDSWFDEHRGVVCLIQVICGVLSEGQRITTLASINDENLESSKQQQDFSVQEVGFLTPTPLRTKTLVTGQVGYVISGMRSTRQARIGDTMYIPMEVSESQSQADGKVVEALPGYEAAKPMLFASVFPVDSNDLEDLFAAVDRLCLNDSSITVTKEHSSALGSGLRCGFLGFLHMEVFNQR
jgi:elongation factor 4